jgi:hypothetical protein
MYPLLRTKTFIKLTKKIKGKFGKRCAKLIPTHIAMLVLWFCMGLWHGGGWNFILEGVWFWAIIVSGEWLSPLFKKITKKFKEENFFWIWFRRLRTMLVYAIGALMFRAGGLTEILTTLLRIFSPSAIVAGLCNCYYYLSSVLGYYKGYILSASLGFVLMLIISRIEFKSGGLAKKLEKKPLFFQILVLFLIVLSIVFFGVYGSGYNAADFIYGGF